MIFTCFILLCLFVSSSLTNEQDENKKFSTKMDQHVCKRKCQIDSPPMTCEYTFEIEMYLTLSKACFDCPFNVSDCFREDCVPADGTERAIVTVNRKLPGPSIEVCQNDIVIVDVMNKMLSETTTIHWHGQPQVSSPYMDGVPFVTQCPILPSNSFRYIFRASRAGTHFWHSHVGTQRVDGAFGSFIVRVPKLEDRHRYHYDHDLSSHVIVINDWKTKIGSELLMEHFHGGGDVTPPILLVNGLGRYRRFNNFRDIYSSSNVMMPTARFTVTKGLRYRFRIINAGALNCPVEFSINNHIFSVISADGNDIHPRKASSLIIYAGERFDVVVYANQPPKLYWMRFKGLVHCDGVNRKSFEGAVLEYSDTTEPKLSYPEETLNYTDEPNEGIQINPLNRGTECEEALAMPKLKSIKKWDPSLQYKPHIQYYIGFDFNNISNDEFHKEPHYGLYDVTKPDHRRLTPQFNHISMVTPPVSLLSQRKELPGNLFCNKETIDEVKCRNSHCQCVHGIKIPLGATVELIFVDEGVSFDVNHPLHLHGYHFRVVAMERLGTNTTVDQVKNRDAKGLIKRNLVDPPLKDTVTVPDGGYTIVRFVANSPGYWILHCHVEVHMILGMTMILQVGERHQMMPVPKNFPKCGNYLPDFRGLIRSRAFKLKRHVPQMFYLFISLIMLINI